MNSLLRDIAQQKTIIILSFAFLLVKKERVQNDKGKKI